MKHWFVLVWKKNEIIFSAEDVPISVFFWWNIVGRISGFCLINVCSMTRFEQFVNFAYSKPGIQVHTLTGLFLQLCLSITGKLLICSRISESFQSLVLFAGRCLPILPDGDPTVIPSIRRTHIKFCTVLTEMARVLQQKVYILVAVHHHLASRNLWLIVEVYLLHAKPFLTSLRFYVQEWNLSDDCCQSSNSNLQLKILARTSSLKWR